MANIYQTFSLAEARYKAFITTNKLEADLFVYMVNQRGLASSGGLWYVTSNRSASSERVFFGSRAIADVIVYFVKNKSEAGWQRPHRLDRSL